VFIMPEGIKGWKAAGQPLEKLDAPPSPVPD
jgi:rhodanese-related sulfurtransferase